MLPRFHHRTASALVVVLLIAAALPALVHAQAPQIEPPWSGELPPEGGVAILQTTRETTAIDVAARLQQAGCNVVSMGVTSGGSWQMYIPGAPAFVNASFPATLQAGRGFVIRCGDLDTAVTMTEANDGGTAHLQVGSQLRVVLPGNPTTGFAWRIGTDVPPSVLTLTADPVFTPSSSAIGAGGVMTFEFLATGPGAIQLHLVYDRVFENVPPEQEWQITVIVEGQQTVAWFGEIKSQPAAPPTARYLELRVPALEEGSVPPGAGIVGSDGATSNAIESFTNTGNEVLVWGELTCGVADYGNCRIDATSVVLASTASALPSAVVAGWAGTLGLVPGTDQPYFQLAGQFPVQYGIRGTDAAIDTQLTELLASGQRIRVWGTLQAGVDDVNSTRIVVTEIALAP